MALSIVRPIRELDLISLVDIIFLLLIFALLVQIGGESGKTPTHGKGDKETTLRIDIGRGRIPDRPELIQIQVVYDNDTNRVDYPPDNEFVSLPHRSFMDMEEVRQTMRHIDTYLNAPRLYPVEGIEVKAQGSVPFKLVDLFVRQFSSAEQENFSLAYRGGQF
jgi:hypothetical protein